MTLRSELPEHAGRQIGMFRQVQATNHRHKHANPRVWVAKLSRIFPVGRAGAERNDVKVLRVSLRVKCWVGG